MGHASLEASSFNSFIGNCYQAIKIAEDLEEKGKKGRGKREKEKKNI